MFNRETYVKRRAELKKLIGEGIIILSGNNESPANFPANGYYPFRQDSSFLYYFGQKRDGPVGAIDIDNDIETPVGDGIGIDDIVWYGSVDSVKDMAGAAGIANIVDMEGLKTTCNSALRECRKVHFLPPYRTNIKIQIFDLFGIHPNQQKESASVELIRAVAKMHSVKTQEEIEELEHAAVIGYKMHTTITILGKPGVTEQFVSGQVNGIANSCGSMVSFPTIFSQRSEIMRSNPSMAVLEAGRLTLCDCGAETVNRYCSDNTRTFPVSSKFTQKQLEIYKVVEECHDAASELSKSGAKYVDVHLTICHIIFDRMKELGLAKGDTDAAVAAGAHAMLLPHGLGHMMGMDVHDMESFDQINVGFNEETRPNLEQFGTNYLRMGRRLEEGFVVADESGIYFIPALIDEQRAKKYCTDFLNFDKLDKYKDFGGIRLEDDLLVTKDGCRLIGKDIIPHHPQDVEDFITANR